MIPLAKFFGMSGQGGTEQTGMATSLQLIYHFSRGISRTPERSVERMLKEVISTIKRKSWSPNSTHK